MALVPGMDGRTARIGAVNGGGSTKIRRLCDLLFGQSLFMGGVGAGGMDDRCRVLPSATAAACVVWKPMLVCVRTPAGGPGGGSCVQPLLAGRSYGEVHADCFGLLPMGLRATLLGGET